jgi:hypothetical protein
MGERRSLVDGLKPPPPPVDPSLEKSFVFGSKESERVGEPTRPNVSRAPLSTRIRSDLAAALKKASLERQLNNQSPNSVQGILEEAIEPWLKSNGYLG